MTGDDEGFLARWSRRKREAEATAPEPAEPATAPAGSDHPLASEQSPDIADIVAQLPPIDQITATTDIRAFLAPGVPSELRLAALRQAWSADPAIRDFIGLAENQWDFNAPDGVPGFGSLVDPEQVRQLLAKVVGGDRTGTPTPSGQDELPSDPQTVAQIAPVREVLNASATEPVVADVDHSGSEAEEEPETADVSPRRHGGALPK